MSPELLAKLESAYLQANAGKPKMHEKKQTKAANHGIKFYRDGSYKICVTIPIGMSSKRFSQLCTQYADRLNDFKNDVEQKFIII
jgi:hypothetical protein